jgi:hypothetical protein
VRRGDVAHIVHIKAKQRTHFGFLEKRLYTRQTLAAEPVEIYALFPINRHRSMSR